MLVIKIRAHEQVVIKTEQGDINIVGNEKPRTIGIKAPTSMKITRKGYLYESKQ